MTRSRPLVWYTVIVMGAVVLAALPSLLGGSSDFVATVTPVAQFVPALASALLIWRMKVGRITAVWGLRLPGRGAAGAGRGRRLLWGLLLALGVVAGVTAVQLLAVVVSGASPWRGLTEPGLLAALPLLVLVTFVPCLAEEVGWRGFGHHVLAARGVRFWGTAATMAAIWSLWHLPAMLAYLRHGDSTVSEVISVLLNLFFGGLGLSALRVRTGSIWAPALGHTLMNTLVVFAHSNLVQPPSQLDPAGFWILQVTGWLGWGIAAVLLAHRRQAVDTAT